MQAGSLGDDMKVHKSRLEIERDNALAARKRTGVNPATPHPSKVLAGMSWALAALLQQS